VERARRHANVYGKVQGVGFRYTAQEVAWRLDLYGWIRNRACGTRVECVVEGPEDSVQAFVSWLEQGPPYAEVERVEVEPDGSSEALKPFAIHPTE